MKIILFLKIKEGNPAYLEWLDDCVGNKTDADK